VLGLVLLALRLALPLVVAPLVAWRLSRALGTRVEIGDLSFQPLDAIVTLRDVTVHAPAQGDSLANPTPPIVADRVRVDVQWLPLFHRMLRVRELALESARVDLDRFPDGEFGLANLERADPASELPAGWSFALDRIALRDSRLRVRDLAAGGEAFLEATVRDVDVSGLQRRATAFGKATNLRIDALVGGGQLRVQGHYELRDDGLVLDALLRVKDVPLAQATSYAADLGWTDLAGQVSGQLRWQREPRRRDLLGGRLVVRRASVRVADLTEPALAVRRGVAEIAAIDLNKRRIAIRSLTLHGPTLALRPDIGAPVPLIAAPLSRLAPRGGRHGAAAHARAESASAWSWMIERFDTANGRVRVLAPDGPFDLRMQAAGENLGPGAYWSPLRIEVAHREITAAFDGTVRLGHGLIIEGRLTTGGMDFPSLARVARLPWAELVQSGRATADLTVGFDTALGDASPFYAHGGIALNDLWLAGQDAGELAFSAASVNLTLEGFSLREPGRAGGSDGRPTQIKFSDVYVGAPSVFLLRTIDGRILPPLAPAPTKPPDETPEIVFGRVRAGDGRVTVVDRVPAPAVTWELVRVDGSAQAVSLPALTFGNLQLRGSDWRFGNLQLGASRQAGTNSFELSATGVPLASTTPYLNLAGLPYRFASGRGSVTARGSIGRAGWSADAGLSFQAPDLIDSDAALQRAIGMPVPAAMALLRDESGDVTLQLTLASSRADGGGTYEERVAAGVRDSITRARQAAAERAAFAPVSVLFPPGQVELTMPAMQELAPLATLLGARPELVVELSADTSHADRRWLAERALGVELEDSGGFAGVLRALGIRAARDRIRSALAARARGAPGRLEPDDEALLARLLAEAPPVDEGQLAALREARLTQVLNYLADTYGIAGRRVVVHSDAPRGGIALAAVRAQVAIGPDPAVDPPGSPPSAATGSIESPVPAR
jgi:uncharacterized protein involved in outer membrane biogenesis